MGKKKNKKKVQNYPWNWERWLAGVAAHQMSALCFLPSRVFLLVLKESSEGKRSVSENHSNDKKFVRTAMFWQWLKKPHQTCYALAVVNQNTLWDLFEKSFSGSDKLKHKKVSTITSVEHNVSVGTVGKLGRQEKTSSANYYNYNRFVWNKEAKIFAEVGSLLLWPAVKDMNAVKTLKFKMPKASPVFLLYHVPFIRTVTWKEFNSGM